jgi:hypothetical protein
LCTEYFNNIHPSSPFPFSILPLTGSQPQTKSVLHSCLSF